MSRLKILPGTEAERLHAIRGRNPIGAYDLGDIPRLLRAVDHHEHGQRLFLDAMVLDDLAVRLRPGDLVTLWSKRDRAFLVEVSGAALVAAGAFLWVPDRFVSRETVAPVHERSGTSEPLPERLPLTIEQVRRLIGCRV